MRLNNTVRTVATAGAALALALGLGSCSRDYTVAYVYAVAGGTTGGTVSAYGVDFETGILNQIAGSPYAIPFTNPSKVIASPNNKFIYIIGGSQNAQVEEFAVGTDGKLYGQNTYDLTGTIATNASSNGTTNAPVQQVGAAIDSTATFLYVTFTYQSGFSPASPGPGGVTIFPINTDGSLKAPITQNVGFNPVGVAVSAPVCVSTPIVPGSGSTPCNTVTGGGAGFNNVYVYVLDQEVTAAKPAILGFAQNQTTGALTPLAGTALSTSTAPGSITGYPAGVLPSAIAVDGTARYVYVTDQEQNEVLGYSIAKTTTGALTALTGSPFSTGSFPVSITIDPRADFVYTANYNPSTVSSFAINQGNGNLSGVAGSSFTTGNGPVCITIDPALGEFVYTSDYIGGTISGGKLLPNTGAISAVADTPFPTSAEPTCVASVATGSHAVQQLTQ